MIKKQIINEVKKIILEYAKPTRIYLYGSMVTGELKNDSDIDIAYDDGDFKDNYLIEEEVQKIQTLIKIDVKNFTLTGERFKNRVISTGRVIYSANKKLRAEDSLYNFLKSFEKFKSVIERKNEFYEEGFKDIYLDVVVKRFEFTYEMCWKTIKRYLDFIGITCTSPRGCFKEAYSQNIIKEQDVFLDMIEMRNLTSHIYNETEVSEILEKLEQYTDAFEGILKKIQIEIGG